MHIGLDYQRQHLLCAALPHLRHHFFHAVARMLEQSRFTALGIALLGNILGQALVFDHHEIVARIRHAGQAEQYDGNRWTGGLDLLSGFVEQRAHAAVLHAAHHIVAFLQRAILYQQRRHWPAALVQGRLDHHSGCTACGCSGQLHHFGLQQHRVEQRVHTVAGLGRQRHHLHVAAVFLRHQFVRDQVLLDAIGIGVGLVDLVDRHDHRHLGGARVLDRFDRLRHHAVVGRDHQDHDVGESGAARAHRTECGVAWRIEETDHALAGFDVVRADVLGDAASLAGCDLGAADVIQQRSLAVIDVAHDGHNWRTWCALAF